MTPRKRTLARVALVAAIVFAVVMALDPKPPTLEVHIWDKWQHMAAFATLAALWSWAYPDAEPLRIGERLSFLGALIEVAQASPWVHRDCDILDWVADTVAIAIVLLLITLYRRRRAAT